MLMLGICISSVVHAQQKSVTGTVTDSSNEPLPGVSKVVKGTVTGTVTDIDGNFNLKVPADAEVLLFSFIGMKTQEALLASQTTFKIVMEEDIAGLEEVIVVGYGTQKKVNVTGSVGVANAEQIEARPVSNTTAALQGLIAGVNISSPGGGKPGSSPKIDIRGLSAAALVLVDGVQMAMNQVDPEDIESVSVLKDAGAAAIYGAQAAGGVILITTRKGKAGKTSFSYSNNFAFSQPTIWPDFADAMSFAHAMNDAALNAKQPRFYNDETLERLQMNIDNPGSAPTMYGKPGDLAWNIGPMGLGAAGNTDWKSVLFNDWSNRQKHNLRVSGGNDKINYYLSGSFFDENGLMKHGEEFFQRYTLDSKVEAQITSWAKASLFVKYNASEQDYPWDDQYGEWRIYDMISKLKVTMPLKYPNGNEVNDPYVNESRIEKWAVQRDQKLNRQLVLSPRVVLEPIKGWVTNMMFNYRTNDNRQTFTGGQSGWLRPNGSLQMSPARETTKYRPRMNSNLYLSPSVTTSYKHSFGDHNVKVLAGYQSERYSAFNLSINATHMLSDNVPSVSTSVGELTADDAISHWATQSVFSRLNYNYKEKYLVELTARQDGASKFGEGDRWGTFPSASAGWIFSKEEFYPLKDIVDFMKFRGSWGNLGDQRGVANYIHMPTMPVAQGTWLFGGGRLYTAGTPNLQNQNVTWKNFETIDVGMDARLFKHRLTTSVSLFQTDMGMITSGEPVPAVLGTSAPQRNHGVARNRGWELELGWKDKIGEVSYGIRGVLSDIKKTIHEFDNDVKLIGSNYAGRVMGDIWGFETAGMFQTPEEVTEWAAQKFINATPYLPGDFKYVDQADPNGEFDNVINQGNNTAEPAYDENGEWIPGTGPGDKKVIGNSTPRYSYNVNGNVAWKGIDFSFMFQGIGKRDWDIRNQTFRGPAQGKFHASVYAEHLDYWRDETSALGANTDAYYTRPYSQNPGRNNKNYRFATTHYLQDASYVRLKMLQVGYVIPKNLTSRIGLGKVRVYASGENLWTITDLKLFDPEVGSGKVYPLAKVVSMGLNVNF